MQHAETALAIAADTGWDVDALALDMKWAGVGVGPVGITRDSEALELSNYRVIYSDLSSRFADAVGIARFGHWAVGWVEEIVWDAGCDGVVAAVAEWRAALDDYPVADDMHYSQTEWDENHPGEGECYAEDCSCDVHATAGQESLFSA